jgi:hypothetical protein
VAARSSKTGGLCTTATLTLMAAPLDAWEREV